MLTLLALLAGAAQGLIALFVYAKQRKSLTNILFTLLSVALVGWAITNYFATSVAQTPETLRLIRLVLFWTVLQNTFFFLFAHSFASARIQLKKTRLKLYLAFSLIVGIAVFTPAVFSHAIIKNGAANPIPAPGMALFVLHALGSVVGGFMALRKRRSDATSREKGQLKYIVLGSVVLWVIVPITNFVVTLAFQIIIFAKLGPLYALIFSSLMAYAMVTQRLFDIRALVARFVAYLFVMATLATTYGLVLFGISYLLLAESTSDFTSNLISVVLAVTLAITFQPLKLFFDRLTDRIFFQDRYDTQSVLNKLSSFLAGEIDIDVILHESLQILGRPMRSQYGAIEVVDEHGLYKYQKYGQAPSVLPNLKELEQLEIKRLAVADDINDTARKETFLHHDIAVAVALRTQNGLVGYILFGPKQSGNIYSDQDLKLIEIASKELAIAIENARAYEKIQAFNVTLQEKVRAATAELQVKNRKLKELDKAKDDFISMASHQLRTPLTTVKGYLSMMLEGDTGKLSKNQRHILDLSYFSAERMVFLITDLLNVSRINTGKFIIEPTPMNLLEVVKSEVEQLQRSADGHEVKLTTKLPAKFPTVLLDDNKTRQVMMNFIDNAIYYTPAGGTVTVELEEVGGAIEFRVVDSGIGVSERDKARLFTKFFRADNAKQQRPDGTGLGLFMAKKVIMAQGGSLIFESQLGKGSTFGFRFALAVLATPKSTPK